MHTTEAADLFSWAKEANQNQRARRKPRQNGFARALALVVEYGHRAELMKKSSIRPAPPPARATCPRCGNDGPVESFFGTRRVNGEVRPQSWCRDCRSEKGRARRTREDFGVLELPFGTAA